MNRAKQHLLGLYITHSAQCIQFSTDVWITFSPSCSLLSHCILCRLNFTQTLQCVCAHAHLCLRVCVCVCVFAFLRWCLMRVHLCHACTHMHFCLCVCVVVLKAPCSTTHHKWLNSHFLTLWLQDCFYPQWLWTNHYIGIHFVWFPNLLYFFRWKNLWLKWLKGWSFWHHWCSIKSSLYCLPNHPPM